MPSCPHAQMLWRETSVVAALRLAHTACLLGNNDDEPASIPEGKKDTHQAPTQRADEMERDPSSGQEESTCCTSTASASASPPPHSQSIHPGVVGPSNQETSLTIRQPVSSQQHKRAAREQGARLRDSSVVARTVRAVVIHCFHLMAAARLLVRTRVRACVRT